MSKIEKTICDACEAEIPEDKVRLQVDCGPPLRRYSADAFDKVIFGLNEQVAEVELRELLKTRKDFCGLECLSRWAINQFRLKQHRAHLRE